MGIKGRVGGWIDRVQPRDGVAYPDVVHYLVSNARLIVLINKYCHMLADMGYSVGSTINCGVAEPTRALRTGLAVLFANSSTT